MSAMATSDLDIPLPATGGKKRTDTLAMVKKLRDAGVPQQQAEAEAEVISETAERVEDVVREEFVPKSAMREDFLALDARLTAMEARLEKRFAQIDKRFSKMEERISQSEARTTRTTLLAFAGFMSGTIVVMATIVTLVIKIFSSAP